MTYKMTAATEVPYPEEFRYRYITSETCKGNMHSHEYYEIFLTLTENIHHTINGKHTICEKGELFFIRPNDEHSCKCDKSYSFINLAFSINIANSLFKYLGSSFPSDILINNPDPPSVSLSQNNCKKLENALLTLNLIEYTNTKKRKLLCKRILVDILTDHFSSFTPKSHTEIPKWLNDTCNQMRKIENFTEGVSAMIRISGKTYVHLARTLKQFHGKTVTEYVNSLRLNYATNLLTQTDFTITKIAMECGFSSTNYFNTCYKKQFGITPKDVRKNFIL